jgi:hypothetical protein
VEEKLQVPATFAGVELLLPLLPPPHATIKPARETPAAIIRTAATRFRRRNSGTPASTAPKAITPPLHGNAGAWFAAELDAVIVSGTAKLPLAASVVVPLAGLTVISGELVVAVQPTGPANVVDANVTVIPCDPPWLSVTADTDGVIV